MSNHVARKWRPFDYKAKFEKRPLLVRSKITIFDVFKRLCKESFENLQTVIETSKPVPLCPIKWRPLKVFTKLHESPLLIANIFKRQKFFPDLFLKSQN